MKEFKLDVPAAHVLKEIKAKQRECKLENRPGQAACLIWNLPTELQWRIRDATSILTVIRTLYVQFEIEKLLGEQE